MALDVANPLIMNNLLNTTVFIVDDDPFTCLIYRKHLRNLGFTTIFPFHSGEECLDNLHREPEIVLLDHDMSQLTGFEVLKKIKRNNPDTSVIMISGQEDMATALDALKYGAFDYIIKGEREVERIESALQRLASLREQAPPPRRRLSLLGKLISIG